MIQTRTIERTICLVAMLCSARAMAWGQDDRRLDSSAATEATSSVTNTAVSVTASGDDGPAPTFEELKAAGALRSSYRSHEQPSVGTAIPQPRLAEFRRDVEPVLKKACVACHGPETQEGNIRIDTLNPDVLHGNDVNWWLEVLAVLSKGEMPPADEAELADHDRSRIIDWLSSEIQVASTVRRAEQGHTSFRRMTRYEYNYVLQDLLGLPYDFARDLPPEPASDDGFQNSSETLHMSAVQFAAYRELGRTALKRATVQGQQPALLYWGVSMTDASAVEWLKQDEELEKLRQQYKDDPEKLKQEQERHAARSQSRHNAAYYKELATGRTARASWSYYGGRYARTPTTERPEVPDETSHVAIIPQGQKLIVELGDQLPEEGTLRVRVRASRTTSENRIPSLQLEFGWQASNDSQATVRISDRDLVVDAAPGQPQFYQWELPLSEIDPRNSMRKIWKMGDLPNPSEYLKLVNSSVSQGDIQIDFVEITAPVYQQWPPASHTRVFFDSPNSDDETIYAQELLTSFMSRAWRRKAATTEVTQKLNLFTKIRPQCGSFQEAMIEVLATVLSSPKFLYLVRSDPANSPDDNGQTPAERVSAERVSAERVSAERVSAERVSVERVSAERVSAERVSPAELATRLSMFLWASTPDDELLRLASSGQLSNSDELTRQVTRMLADSRARRFSRHFVRQWLGMQLLDFLNVDRKAYPQFSPSLKEAMQEEPVAFFHEVLLNNHSVLDFVHADYTMANERLAKHYGMSDVFGNEFRRVKLEPQHRRGGLLTQAGLLAMNSDGKDSHPLKRGIWLLESLLNDPPPPPPPAVPEIDLADPEIAKMTLKQRIENHRNHAACLSCHAKIDPWGIAFENFDAVGSWRTQIQGQPVDASSLLFNKQKLDGIDGLKRFLLEHRQDQFARAIVHKLVSYALGRPLTFGDRSSVDQITANLRKQGDGLATLVTLVVTSDLFSNR